VVEGAPTGAAPETTVTCRKGTQGALTSVSRNWGGTIIKQGSAPVDPTIAVPGQGEPVDPEVRTFADIENGDPDTVFDEIALDAAII
jgi:hypothetical protein